MQRFLSAAHTDVGIKKKKNQDAVLLMEAETGDGNALLAAVSDGMGGLEAGEEASRIMTEALEGWFRNRLPLSLSGGTFDEDSFMEGISGAIYQADNAIADYEDEIHGDCGTTVSLVFLYMGKWYVANVGDSRVYHHDGSVIMQLTKDHTLVQQEVDQGRMTKEEAEASKDRNILLQCVGAGGMVDPDWFCGTYKPGDVFLVCCDGFRHVLGKEDFFSRLHPDVLTDEMQMESVLKECTDEEKRRGERDNISAILVKVAG